MSVLQGVLKEELDRLEYNLGVFQDRLSSFPRGTIFIKKNCNSSFVYRKKKTNGKVQSEYIGKLSNNKSIKAINDAEEYKRYKLLVKNTIIEINKLKRALKIYE